MKGIGKTLVGKLKAQAQAGNPLDEMSAEAGSGKGITAPNIVRPHFTLLSYGAAVA